MASVSQSTITRLQQNAAIQDLAAISGQAWCLWKMIWKKGADRPEKQPYTTGGDPMTVKRRDGGGLSTLDEVIQACIAEPTEYSGVGLYPTKPLLCIDLDDVVEWRDGVAIILDDAQDILARFDTYAEYSPTRTGLHIWLIHHGEHPKTKKSKVPLPGGAGGIEMFFGNRTSYLTMTGDTARDVAIKSITAAELDETIQRYYGQETPQEAPQRTKHPTPATPPANATPGAENDFQQRRLIAWAEKAWPGAVNAGIQDMKAAIPGALHDTRTRIGARLGCQYRALEIACDTLRVSRPYIFTQYATRDDIIKAIYQAQEPKSNQRKEYAAIEHGFEHGYTTTDTWQAWGENGAPQALTDIMNNTQNGQETPQEGPQRTKHPTPATPPANDDPLAPYIDFNDILQPNEDALQRLTTIINEARAGGKEWNVGWLFDDATTMRAQAARAPVPVIESTQDQRHLLMPGVSQLAAASKAGKSTIALHFAYAVATGGDVFGSDKYHVRQPGRVVYFDLENHAGITGARIEDTFDHDPENYRHVPPDKWRVILGVANKRHVDRWRAMQWYITQTLRAWPDTRLIILDNVLQFQPRRDKYTTPEEQEEMYMMWLAGVAETYPGLAIILVDHNTKAQATDNEAVMTAKAQGSFRKHALLTGGVLTVYTAPQKDNMPDGTLKIATTMRACENTALHIKRDETRGHHTLIDVQPLPLTVVQRRIYNAIRNGATTKPDIDAALPTMASTHIANELARMVAKGVIYRPGHGTYAISTQHYTQTTTEHSAT